MFIDVDTRGLTEEIQANNLDAMMPKRNTPV